MTYKGIAKGKTIELEEPLPYKDGQPVSVSIEPVAKELVPGSPEVIRRAMHSLPHLDKDAVDELERVIRQGRLPISTRELFDSER